MTDVARVLAAVERLLGQRLEHGVAGGRGRRRVELLAQLAERRALGERRGDAAHRVRAGGRSLRPVEDRLGAVGAGAEHDTEAEHRARTEAQRLQRLDLGRVASEVTGDAHVVLGRADPLAAEVDGVAGEVDRLRASADTESGAPFSAQPR